MDCAISPGLSLD